MTTKGKFNKAACKRLAVELREEANIEPMQSLDPWMLADMYGVHVVPLSALALSDPVRQHFAVARPEIFSGALMPFGNGAIIVENDSHLDVRRRSTLGHELAHVFSEHKFGTSLVNERGCRMADQTQEAEAAELAGELLVPFEAAKLLARQKVSDHEVAMRFGVSVELARWRMHATGARLIAQRRAAAHRRTAPGR